MPHRFRVAADLDMRGRGGGRHHDVRFGSKADMRGMTANVRFVPIADIKHRSQLARLLRSDVGFSALGIASRAVCHCISTSGSTCARRQEPNGPAYFDPGRWDRPQRLFLARVTAALRAASRRLRVVAAFRAAARRFRVIAPFWAGESVTLGLAFMVFLPLNGGFRAKVIEAWLRLVATGDSRLALRLQACHIYDNLAARRIFSPLV